MKSNFPIIAALVCISILALILAIILTKRRRDKFANTNNGGPTYCAGCHAQLPPHLERPCNGCTPRPPCPNCSCNERKRLRGVEREDLHLYGYLMALLTAMGVDDKLHPDNTDGVYT